MKRLLAQTTVLISCALVFLSTAVMGETLEDWKVVQGKTGCYGVPYSTLRENCRRQQEKVDEYCKETEYKCDPAYKTKGLLESINGIKIAIQKIEEEKAAEEKRHLNASTENERREAEEKVKESEKQLTKRKTDLEDHQKRLEDNRAEAERRVSKGERCRDARQDMYGIFTDVIRQANGESDPEIKALAAAKIANEWEPENKKHKRHLEENTLPAIEKCNKCRSGDM